MRKKEELDDFFKTNLQKIEENGEYDAGLVMGKRGLFKTYTS